MYYIYFFFQGNSNVTSAQYFQESEMEEDVPNPPGQLY